MKFLRLPDYLLSVLFENEEILAFDKPYGFNSHTNDSKIEHSEFIQDGLIEILEKQFEKRLYIIHRLDQTTTGVIIFGKTPEAAKKYAEYFFNREVKKTYLFVTARQSAKTYFRIDDKIIHKGKELEADTELKFLKKSKVFELWQANPHTGRNHQIRIHAQAAGLSILGDSTYQGQAYPFLCLHNQKIEFPNGLVIQSKPPVYFDELLILENPDLALALFEADRRYRLFSDLKKESVRLGQFHLNSLKAEISIDDFGQMINLNWPDESPMTESQTRFVSHFSKWIKKPVLIRRPKSQTGNIQQNWIALENKISFEIRSESAQPGLFLNQRLQRNWVLGHSRGKSVLNLFANTCSFSVVAAVGGARDILSIESNKNYLQWGQKNFVANQIEKSDYKFLCRDSFSFIKQAEAKSLKFDLIICEAPSFARMEKGVFKIEKDLEALLESALQCLDLNGELLFSTAAHEFLIDDLRKLLKHVQTKIGGSFETYSILPSLDFELPGEKVGLKSFLVKKLG